MKTGNAIMINLQRGDRLRRAVAMLLVVLECFSTVAVGIPTAYAEGPDSSSAPYAASDTAMLQSPDDEGHVNAEDSWEQDRFLETQGGEALDYYDGTVAVSGTVPVDTEVNVRDVTEQYADFDPADYTDPQMSDPDAFLTDETERSVMTQYRVLTAQSIMLTHDGETLHAELEKPLEITISNPDISEDLNLQVWHIDDYGLGEQVAEFRVRDDSVSFPADSFSTYLVAEVTVDTTVSANSGESCRISVSYDQDADLPENAELAVRELSDDEYNNYVNYGLEVLGAEAKDLLFARVFNIDLIDPESGFSLRPASAVRISIELLDTDVNEAESLYLLCCGDETRLANWELNDNALVFEEDGGNVCVILGLSPEEDANVPETLDSENADAEGSDNESADAEGSDSEGADAEGTDNENADAEGTNNESADAEGTDNEGADAEGTDSESANAEGTDNESADAEGSDNENADAEGTDNESADAEGTDNESGDAEGSDSENADAEGTDNESADAEGTDNESADAEGTDGENADAEGTNNEGADAEGSDSESADAEGSDSENTDAEGSDSENTDAEGTNNESAAAEGSDSESAAAEGSDSEAQDAEPEYSAIDYSDDAVNVSGEVPDGTDVTATDVLALDPERFAAFAQMLDQQPEAELELDESYTLNTDEASAEVSGTGANRIVLAAYDISLSFNGGEYQPDEDHPLRVSITADAIGSVSGLQIWHLPDEGDIEEITDFTTEGNTVSFEVSGLSIYAVTGYTVDFHWGDYTYSIEGESEITLSALLEKLGVTEITTDDVVGVAFSDPTLIDIIIIEEDEEQTADWLLRSLAPFDTEEALILTLKNGVTVEIKVTDEGEETYTVTWRDADGTELEKDENVAANTHPSYDGETPTKTDESGLSYVFAGWEPAVTEETVVTGDVTFTAKFAIALTITADSAVKFYDETALTRESYTSTVLAEGDSIESLTYTVKNGIGDDAETVEAIDVGTYYNVPGEARIVNGEEDVTASYAITYVNGTLDVFRVSATFNAGEYNTANKTVPYTATISVQGNPGEYAVRIADLTAAENSDLTFSAGSYTYTHAEGVTPEEGMESQINGINAGETETDFTSFPLTVSRMYNGDTLTLSYTADTAAVDHAAFAYNSESGQVELNNTLTLDYVYGETKTPAESKDASASVDYTPLTREFVRLEGSWAYWKVTVNPEGYKLNGGNEMTLADTFDDGVLTDAEQVIDYHRVAVDPNDVAYDYRGSTGTFVISDMTPVTITYRTRITAEPEQVAYFRGTAVLKSSEDVVIASSTAGAIEEGIVIYPSASDVAGFGTNYMVKLYVYADGAMQTGLEGAKFILMDANQRPLEYKMGENEGQPVTFTTGSDGYADVDLHDEEAGDVAIEKNTRYYLEMIQTPAGYQKDNTLYTFLIRDNPNYSDYEYYNGDTLKMRLYPAEPGLKVALRFSGSYALRDDQKDNVIAVLQKMEGEENWVEVERHFYSETNWGYITFTTPLYDENKAADNQDVFRVVEENVRPWDLPEEIILQQSYFCMVNDGDSDTYSEPQEFYVTAAADTVNVVIENRYEEAQLTIIKMDKNTGAKLAGAKFGVYKIENGVKVGDAVVEYTTDEEGKLVVRGGEEYESEVLYGICETEAPENYVRPLQEIWHYFYFCNDEYLEPSILANLPEGAEALNLTNSGIFISLDNQKETVTIPVMALWQGNTWPSNTQVTIGLYQSVDGAEPTAVTDTSGNARTVVLSSTAPYNHTAFADLLSRDDENRNITYSIKEELINDVSPIAARYVQEYGVSDAGVYIVRNKPATSLTVKKEWYDWTDNTKVEDQGVLAAQSPVTFDVYRSTDTVGSGEITNAQMAEAVGDMTRVRENLTIGPDTEPDKNWTRTIDDLDQQSDDGQRYFYHVIERVPSFGNEVYSEAYQIEGLTDTVTIKNKVAPETAALTVTKAALVDDPRTASLDRDFEFTLKLENDRYPIREWTVYTDTVNHDNDLVTDWNGEVRFTLKPTNPDITPTPGASITLTLPKNVTATVTETYNSEYTVKTTVGETTAAGASYTYNVENDTALTYTNTLRVVCKIITDGGKQIPFESFKSALARLRSPEAEEAFTSPWTIYMLEDYEIPATDEFIVQKGESITLTTASTTDTLFPFKAGQTETDRAVITRGGAGGSMLTNAGTLTLENIVLDGNNDTAATDGGLVYSTDTLNLNAKTTLRNSAISGNGGAVYATGMTKETVDPESGENVQTFVPGTVNIAEGVVITGNSAAGASAIWLRGTLNMSGGSITDNTGASDGAVVVENHGDVINLSGSPVISDNTNRANGAANLYIGVDSDNIVNVVAPGLGANAQIGITAMEGHMEIGELFAMAAVGITDNLKSFVNDKYGYRGKLKDGTLTNVAWDGLELTIKKAVAVVGANANDRFTITLSSPDIKKSSYIIDGTLDYTVTAARTGRPGTIEIKNVKHGDEITISPLPVADYTISEAESNYNPSFAVDGGDPTEASSITFTAEDDKLIELTNTRRLADVKLTKKLDDRLAGDAAVPFSFTVLLTEANGTTPVAGFPLVTDETGTPDQNFITDEFGKVTFTMSPTDADDFVREFKAPVGATMTITETENPNYEITVSAVTAPAEGEGEAIADLDEDADNVFSFRVTDDKADVTFANKRKMAEIELSKTLVGKVSKSESFTFTVTLKNQNGTAVKDYVLYRDDAHPGNNITTNDNGVATITFTFGENETEPKSIPLTVPDGTKLTVEETVVKKDVNGTQQAIYNTTYSRNGGTATTGTTLTINKVSETDKSIAFTNTRKTNTIVVKNTVKGYAGNVDPFSYTATVTDGGENAYNDNGFENGVMTFELVNNQTQTLKVPYGATLTVTETFIVGYDTTVKRGNAAAVRALSDTFQVSGNISPLLFTNSQLIGLQLVNQTSHVLENVTVTVGDGKEIFLVNENKTGQRSLGIKTATLDPISSPESISSPDYIPSAAILEVQHDTSTTAEQPYTITGSTPADGYYYTIYNEPSFHESADPAILRVYDAAGFTVKGKLRYSVNDSIVTFTEQPLVSFDSNGGAWTTEMDGYRDRDSDRKVYQKAVITGETVAKPTPDPIYPTAESIPFLGWTTDEDFAKAGHTAGEDISAKAYDFDTPVTAPITLYAVWAKPARDTYTVTLRNSTGNTMNLSLTLINSSRVGNITLADSVVTDKSGKADITFDNGSLINLSIPAASKFVIQGIPSDVFGVSEEFTDSDSMPESYTIASVNRDGTVSFTAGVCKITDAAGNILYDIDGKPAVYGTLAAAFTAYNGTLYPDADHTTPATQACVKMLVDEYTIQQSSALTFPNATMTLTTAGKTDADFPYVGERDRSIIYRSAGGVNNSCFTFANGTVTLTEIVLDGGSERGVKVNDAKNGALINVTAAGATLNIDSGTTLRNVEYTAYTSNDNGGAVYMTNGTLNVNAGLFSNLHAYQGGAICVTGGTLNVTGTAGSTQFEDCRSEKQDGGAIYHSATKDVVIDGGTDKDNPGIIFTRCVAAYTNGTGDGGDGGAIFATSNYTNTVTVKGCSFIECSARTGNNASTSGYGGGGICAYKVKGLTVEACTFESCDTLCGGGAVAAMVKYTETVDNETVTIANCSFNQCNCKGQAGALGVYQNDNGKSNSATKLSVINSVFNNCSSGTNNGSGGAIQCYLPCLVFSDSSFTDCWAGKEGGAINNFFANKYGDMWPKSSLTLSNCTFTRCRAEDRYQADQMQHYGGAINTKVKTVTVTGSTFIDCVSTLREGGALHLGGIGTGSTATITGSTFIKCMAKTGGGAVMASNETLTVSDSFFYGCQAFGMPESNYKYDNGNKKNQNGGGAISHSENSRNNSTQNTTTITNCVFSANPNGGEDALSCSTATNGGAIWTRATTNVTIDGCTIDGCAAGTNGGGVYLDTIVAKATITGGSIKNCQAVSGSAVYVGNQATFSGNLEVSGNTVSGANSGAIQTVDAGKLYFEGNVKVEDNTSSAEADDHDVLMQINGNTIINTTSVGLGSGAHIGVYVSDPNNAYANHGQYSQPFGTYHNSDAGSNFLDAFFNDRDGELYGYQGTGDLFIHWGFYVCKITDADGNTLTRTNGRDAVYQQLQLAVDEFMTVTGGEPIYIKMLVENYAVRQTEAVSNFPAADITLTTETYTGTQAVTGEYDGKHPYRGTEGTVSTINRANSENPLFSVSTEKAFKLQNITLDGRKDKTAATGDYKLITADAGEIVVNSGTTLQYAKGDNGAAITGVKVTINGSYDTENKEPTVKITNCAATGNGGAISAQSLTITNSSDDEGEYGSTFVSCTAAGNGGAICISGTAVSMTGASFTDCHSTGEGGVLSHGYTGTDEAVTAITNCAFKNGYSENGAGGAVSSNADTLTVDASSFDACTAAGNGGAINHTESSTATITATTFKDCETSGTGTNNDEGFGGSVYTGAETVTLTGVSFRNSTAANHGGALYCASSAEGSAAISGTSFETCSVNIADGAGGAIYSKTKALTLQDYKPEDSATATKTTINACTAPSYSGAVYMETVGSILNVTGNTKISDCYAKQGGAIYLKSGVTMNLTGGVPTGAENEKLDTPEFTLNGYTMQNGAIVEATEGACIYLAEGSRINFSGNLKFSRNILPNQDRITNGGITDYVRQDIFLAGYSGVNAASIYIVGELPGDTIWVWPEQSPHRLPNEQFAKITGGVTVTPESLSKLRNALADTVTNCSNGEYLAGVQVGTDAVNVYWDKMYVVSFLKKDNKTVAVPGAGFTLYSDSDCTIPVATAKSANGENDTDAQGTLLARGMVEFTSIRIGAYYMKETDVPSSFKENNTTYLVLVGTPYLAPNDNNRYLWENGGPLDVSDAATLVQHHTTEANKYYGIFPLDANGKAVLRANLASNSVGIENIRNDYQVSFMKLDEAGNPLPGAAFTIYSAILNSEGRPETFDDDYPKLMRWSRDGETYPEPVVSADGTAKFKDKDNRTLPKGLVYFRELPLGTYYLLETAYPERNGSNRRTFFVESDRVFKLEIKEINETTGEIEVTLSEWKYDTSTGTSSYETLPQDNQGYYVVSNQEVVCKLTNTINEIDKLLYVTGHTVWENKETESVRLFPAIYPTLEEGFETAQTGSFVYADGSPADVSALKLQVLKDFTISEPITYSNADRPLTFTTASRTASTTDRYVFSTNRTSDTSRALISRAYDESDVKEGAVITLENVVSLTLQNIRLDGKFDGINQNGRAIRVKNSTGSGNTGEEKCNLTIGTQVQFQNFKVESDAFSELKGGAILMDDGTSLTIDGGYNRTAIFSNNAVVNTNSNDGYDGYGGAVAVGANCTFNITNARFSYNKATASAVQNGCGGALTISDENQTEHLLQNVVFTQNTATGSGGAVCIGENSNLNLEVGNCTFSGNEASNRDGGAIAVLSNTGNFLTLKIGDGSSFTSNKAPNGNGGAVMIGSYGTLNIMDLSTNQSLVNNATLSSNTAVNGGAIYAAPNAEVTINRGTLQGNSAALGSAVYAGNSAQVTVIDASITGNKATGTNGGAINVDKPNEPNELNARLYFGGTPTVFDNFGALGNSQQMNLVLSEDSNAVINTTVDGLTDGTIGVFVIESDNTVFEKHGLPGKPFGTFGDTTTHSNPQVFRSDHSLALYGVRNEDDPNDDLIYWVDVICKLTDDSDKILYQDISLNISGNKETRKAQAVYARITQPENPDLVKNGFNALRDGFEAAQGTLYSQNGTTYTALTNETVKLKMLKDVALDKGIVHTGSRRAVIFTTAETSVSTDMRSAGDFFPYMTERTDANGTLLTDGIALIIRNYDGDSMIEAGGASLGMTNITLDGALDITRTVIGAAQNIRGDGVLTGTPTLGNRVLRNATATVDGGIVFVRSGGAVTVADGATLQNARTSANGGAVYAENRASVTVTGGTINGNTAYTGAGIYLAYTGANNHATLYLSGNPDFGGTGVENNALVTVYATGEKAGKTAGNFSLNALADDAKNGGMAYTTARQDIYLAGTDKTLRSVVLTGVLTDPENPNNLMQPGSIWVWAEGEAGKDGEINHYKVLKQFAVYGNGVKDALTNAGTLEASLKAFRNARTDEATENATSSYLDGTGEGEDAGCIYWSGVKGSRRVILRKVVGPTDGKYSSMQNVSFNVYAHGETDMTKFYVVKHEFKVDNKIILATERLSGLKPGANGVFWVGELPFGEYDIEEVGVGWFLLIVGDKDRNGHDLPDGYWISPRGDAKPQ